MSQNASRGRILVVDDEVNARVALSELLRDEGYSVETAADGFKALPKLEEFNPNLVLSDLKMPGLDGLELMRRAHTGDPERVVVLMTAYGGVETAVAAMREGASDYLTKPINVEELLVVIERGLERQHLRAETQDLRRSLRNQRRLSNLVGSSRAMQDVFDTIMQVAPTRATVLVTGESGTGKELLAAALHEHSARAQGPFIKLHCAALAENLLESELFGHERGAFTGALARRDGRFLQADGGTLFLDEIGEISPAIQIKLLRFLQEREFERVGGNQTIKVDVRIIAATNRDLQHEVSQGRFREDLYYRLNVVAVEMPPLRVRREDVPVLAMYFLQRHARANDKDVQMFNDAALALMSQYDWPGNVRELENAVERAVVVCRGTEIVAEDLPRALLASPPASKDDCPAIPGATFAELERYAILKTLEHVGGSTSRAADMLGMSVRKIQYKLQDYGPSHGLRAQEPARTDSRTHDGEPHGGILIGSAHQDKRA